MTARARLYNINESWRQVLLVVVDESVQCPNVTNILLSLERNFDGRGEGPGTLSLRTVRSKGGDVDSIPTTTVLLRDDERGHLSDQPSTPNPP